MLEFWMFGTLVTSRHFPVDFFDGQVSLVCQTVVSVSFALTHGSPPCWSPGLQMANSSFPPSIHIWLMWVLVQKKKNACLWMIKWWIFILAHGPLFVPMSLAHSTRWLKGTLEIERYCTSWNVLYFILKNHLKSPPRSYIETKGLNGSWLPVRCGASRRPQ